MAEFEGRADTKEARGGTCVHYSRTPMRCCCGYAPYAPLHSICSCFLGSSTRMQPAIECGGLHNGAVAQLFGTGQACEQGHGGRVSWRLVAIVIGKSASPGAV